MVESSDASPSRTCRYDFLPPPRAPLSLSFTHRPSAYHRFQMLGVLGIFKARGTKVFNEMVGKSSQIAGGALTSLMPIKCLLGTQIYGPFLANMALPPLLGMVVMLAMFPITLARRAHEKFLRNHDEEMKTRREKAAIHHDDATVADITPRWEPIVNTGSCCFKCPSKTAVKIPCCRKVPSEEYIINYRRNKEGLRPNAPRYETRLGVDASIACGIPQALLMACECCRVESTEKVKLVWRAEQAVRKQRVNFKPIRRVVAVMVRLRCTLACYYYTFHHSHYHNTSSTLCRSLESILSSQHWSPQPPPSSTAPTRSMASATLLLISL